MANKKYTHEAYFQINDVNKVRISELEKDGFISLQLDVPPKNDHSKIKFNDKEGNIFKLTIEEIKPKISKAKSKKTKK